MRKDGTSLDISATISPLKDSTGGIIGASKVARDISKQKQAEQVLRESEERYRKLARSLDAEVRDRTNKLEVRNADVLQQSAQLRDLSRRLLQAQDDERRHIARELHDSAGQTLTVLGMNLAHLAQDVQDLSPEVAKQVQDSEALVQQLHQEIRTTSYLLHPPLLEESGLVSALSWYIQGLSKRSKLDIQLTIAEDFGRLPRDMELLVFRLVQECLTNIHRHSGSQTVSIQLARKEDAVTVDVEDHGHGMSPAKLAEVNSHSAGLGIRGMRERLRQFDGSMNIESDSSGTRVSVIIPLESSGEHQGMSPIAVLI
jgi:signal transduction histidine kinase